MWFLEDLQSLSVVHVPDGTCAVAAAGDESSLGGVECHGGDGVSVVCLELVHFSAGEEVPEADDAVLGAGDHLLELFDEEQAEDGLVVRDDDIGMEIGPRRRDGCVVVSTGVKLTVV